MASSSPASPHQTQPHQTFSAGKPAQPQVMELAPYVRNVLQVVLHADFEETVLAVTQLVGEYHWERDNTTIWNWMPPNHGIEIMSARILEVVSQWIRWKIRSLDDYIKGSSGRAFRQYNARDLIHGLASAAYQSPWHEVFAEFIYTVVFQLLHSDASSLGSVIAGSLPK